MPVAGSVGPARASTSSAWFWEPVKQFKNGLHAPWLRVILPLAPFGRMSVLHMGTSGVASVQAVLFTVVFRPGAEFWVVAKRATSMVDVPEINAAAEAVSVIRFPYPV